MKQIITLLLIIAMAGVLWWQYHSQVLALEDHRRQQHDDEVNAGLREQADCLALAQARFRQLGYTTSRDVRFRSHYNASHAICFVLIERNTVSLDTDWHNITLSDVAKHTVYGAYSAHMPHGTHPAGVTPFTCEVLSASRVNQPCKSEPEFRQMIKAWMQ